MVQHEHGPERLAVVGALRLVLVVPAAEDVAVQNPVVERRRIPDHLIDAIFERAAEPAGQRDAEPLLGAIDDLIRNLPARRQLQQVLARTTAQLVARRERGAELEGSDT